MRKVLEQAMGLLSGIESPRDLKRIPVEKLPELASEIRKYMLEVLSERGGHLASSLGSVEITLALHYVFDSPVDRIVWDVGHQSYTHKIVTGRREAFRDLRTRGGISGFPRTKESEHDAFGAGHACTAISAALGMAVARDLRGDDNFVIGVVGDGAISGGMSLEGINHAGHLKKNRLVIILNDNEMSISRNVGALARYLTRITTRKLYLQLEADVWELLGRIPTMGGTARKLASRIKESIKNLVVPTILFEELGFRYLGPLDGHDIGQMIDTFSQLHQIPGPVLVHVVTRKGKGYSFAEEDAEKYHGVGGFYKTTGGSRSAGGEKYSGVFGQRLERFAEKDGSIVAVTAAMKEGTGLSCFARKLPDRFFDVGISEQHAVTFAAGMARLGMKPYVAIYSTFLQRSFDQIIHDVALQELPVRFILDRAGIVGEDGPTHHGTFDLSYMGMIPGMVIMAPSDECELCRMLATSLTINDRPSAIRFPRGTVLGVDMSDCESAVEIGRGRILREGRDVSLLAAGSMVHPALKAADLLSKRGIEASVADARFVKPIDIDLVIGLVSGDRPLFTIEENVISGGFGDAVELAVTGRGERPEIRRIGLDDSFVPHGSRSVLLEEAGLTPGGIAESVERSLARNSG